MIYDQVFKILANIKTNPWSFRICPLQHLQDLVFPNKGCNATPGPSPPSTLLHYISWLASAAIA